jgi:hypothetical protein
VSEVRPDDGSSPQNLWTPQELADHWGVPCNRDFWRIIDDQAVPFLYLGKGTPTKGGRAGPRGKYRFPPAAIAAWERERIQSFRTPGEEKEVRPRPAPDLIAQALGGKVYGGRKGKKGPRRTS